MGDSDTAHTGMPDQVEDGLERFCSALREALGEELESVALYGGLVKGEYSPGGSDVNVLVVVREVTIEVLDGAVAAVQQGMRDFRLATMFLTTEDLRRSTDVFPTKFLDMQQHHRVLWGKEVLRDLTITRDHLRLRCEQEIKNLLLRLRQLYLGRAHRPELIEQALIDSLSTFRHGLRVLLELKGVEAPVGMEATIDQAARELGLDGEALRQVITLRSGDHCPDANELKRLYGAFMSTVAKAADEVDRLPGGGT